MRRVFLAMHHARVAMLRPFVVSVSSMWRA